MQAQIFKSRIDTWLFVVLGISGFTAIGTVVAVAIAEPAALWVGGLTLLVGVGLPLWLILQTDYSLVDGTLLIRSGPFRWKVPVAAIRSIVPTRNPLSSPALSLDRLQIDYGPGKSIMVSPQDKQAFIDAIQAHKSRSE